MHVRLRTATDVFVPGKIVVLTGAPSWASVVADGVVSESTENESKYQNETEIESKDQNETDNEHEHEINENNSTSLSVIHPPAWRSIAPIPKVHDTDTPSTSNQPPKPAFADHLTPACLTTIGSLPSASQLVTTSSCSTSWRRRPTINVVAGILATSRPRAVLVRNRRAAAVTTTTTTVYLVELVLGDDTGTGLALSLWQATMAGAQAQARRLRRGDVVLAQDVMLAAFDGRVQGRSVRAGWRTRGTRLRVLYRGGGDGGGYYSRGDLDAAAAEGNEQLERTRAVAAWTARFVRECESCERPPADSQQEDVFCL